MHELLGRLRRRVYRRSLTKNIGVLEAIDELRAEAGEAQERGLLERLRAAMEAYHRQRRRARYPARGAEGPEEGWVDDRGM
jgi:hypothetical protein